MENHPRAVHPTFSPVLPAYFSVLSASEWALLAPFCEDPVGAEMASQSGVMDF